MSEPVVTYCRECATPARVQVPEAHRAAGEIREWCWSCQRYRTMAIPNAKAPAEVRPRAGDPAEARLESDC